MEPSEQPPWLRDVFALRANKGIDARNRLLLEGSRLVRAALAAKADFELAIQTPEHFGDGGSAAVVAQLAGRGVASHRLAGTSSGTYRTSSFSIRFIKTKIHHSS